MNSPSETNTFQTFQGLVKDEPVTPTRVLVVICADVNVTVSAIQRLIKAKANVNEVASQQLWFGFYHKEWIAKCQSNPLFDVANLMYNLGSVPYLSVDYGFETPLSNAIQARRPKAIIQTLLNAKANVDTVCFEERNETIWYADVLHCTPRFLEPLQFQERDSNRSLSFLQSRSLSRDGTQPT